MEEQSREVEAPLPAPVLDGELHLLLGDLKDDVSGYRRREAAWISVIVHGALILALVFMPKWVPKSAVLIPIHENENAIFMPSEPSPKMEAPHTNRISDHSTRAMTRTPTPDKEALRMLQRRPGPPQPAAPPPQPAQQAQQATSAPPQAGAAVPAQPQTTAALQAPQPRQNPFAISSPGSAVDQAIRSAANNRPSTGVTFGGGGDMGSGVRPKVDTRGALDILSDTRGVDFGPYMKRLHVTVEDHWYPLIPEVALAPMMKKGRVVIEFAIMKDGTIQGLTVVSSSGDVALDRAAYGALMNAVPLPRLPAEFTGDFLKIRAAFFYNPDKSDME